MGSIQAAIDDLKSQTKPLYRATARKYNVPYTTLRAQFQGLRLSKEEYHETRQLLSHAQERVLLDRINTLSERGLPPTNSIIKNLAREIAGEQPGKNWVYEFLKRHDGEVALVSLEGFDLSRQKADNYISIKQYFDLVCGLILYIFIYILILISYRSDGNSRNTKLHQKIVTIWMRRDFL
jgi:hypothetical protein